MTFGRNLHILNPDEGAPVGQWKVLVFRNCLPLFSSVTQSCPTLCDPMDCTAHQASLSITNSQSLLRLTESVIPSNHLILCLPLLLPPSIFPSIRVFPNDLVAYTKPKPARQSTKIQKWSYTFAGPTLTCVLLACAIADLQAIWTSEPLFLPFFTPRPNCFFLTLSDILVSWPPPCSWPH